MGRGNTCVHGEYEGLFYIDNDDLNLFSKKESDAEVYPLRSISFDEIGQYEFDEVGTDLWINDVQENLVANICQRIKSMNPCNEWVSRSEKAILENGLFYVVLEDNEWSIAVKLIQKDDACAGFQSRFFNGYLAKIRDALFEQFDELGVYAGAWTHGTIKKEAFA